MAQFVTEDQYYRGRADVKDWMMFVDEPKDMGGTGNDPSPTEYLLVALASCIGITLQMYTQRKEWDTGKITVVCDYNRDENNERIITKKLRYENFLSDEQEQRLAEISSKCPVSKMLSIKVVYLKE